MKVVIFKTEKSNVINRITGEPARAISGKGTAKNGKDYLEVVVNSDLFKELKNNSVFIYAPKAGSLRSKLLKVTGIGKTFTKNIGHFEIDVARVYVETLEKGRHLTAEVE